MACNCCRRSSVITRQIQASYQHGPTGLFRWCVIRNGAKQVNKISFSDMKENRSTTTQQKVGIAVTATLLCDAWVSQTRSKVTWQARTNGDFNIIGFTVLAVEIAPGKQGTLKFNNVPTLAAKTTRGKKNILKVPLKPRFDVDYGWLWWLAKLYSGFANFDSNLRDNLGYCHYLDRCCVKASFFKLSCTS